MAIFDRTDFATAVRGMATGDHAFIESLLKMQIDNIVDSGLDPKTHALVRIASLITLDAPPASYMWQVGIAKESGVSDGDVLGVLIALAPTIGMARVVAAAPEIAFALDIALDDESTSTEGASS